MAIFCVIFASCTSHVQKVSDLHLNSH